MKRSENVDKVRAGACLLVLLYHCWTLCGNVDLKIPIIKEFVMLGGDIGVTAFFVLSGYGIYHSLYNSECNGGVTFRQFMVKRIKRVAPQYYFNLLIALLFTGSAVYITKEHIMTIVSHLFFVHNFSLAWHGAINGVLWTMAIIFQFYIFSMILFKFVNYCKFWSLCISILFTIIAKIITLNYLWVLDAQQYGSFAFSIPGRQLWTAIDNFVVGMYLAYLVTHKCLKEERYYIAGCFGCAGLIVVWSRMGLSYGIYGNNLWCCSWHSILAVLIGSFIFFAYNSPTTRGIISCILLWVSKYEYGIYLWHLLIINNLLKISGLVTNWMNSGRYIRVYIIFCVCSILVGYIITELFSPKKDIIFSKII